MAAFNDLAEYVKTEYNPDGTEDGDSIRSDSTGDLVVNLAIGFLDNPEAEAYDVIAASWKDLDLADFPSFTQWRQSRPEQETSRAARAVYRQERRAAIVAEGGSWF